MRRGEAGQSPSAILYAAYSEIVAGNSSSSTTTTPKPLYYQLEAEHPQQFSWTYLERGPEVWRVEIGRLLKAA